MWESYSLSFFQQSNFFFHLMILFCYFAVLFVHLHWFLRVMTRRQRLYEQKKKKNTAFECNIRNEHIFWKIKSSVHLCENREKVECFEKSCCIENTPSDGFPQKGKNAFLHMNMHKPSNFVRIFSAFHNNFAKYHERLFKERFLPYLFLFHL